MSQAHVGISAFFLSDNATNGNYNFFHVPKGISKAIKI